MTYVIISSNFPSELTAHRNASSAAKKNGKGNYREIACMQA